MTGELERIKEVNIVQINRETCISRKSILSRVVKGLIKTDFFFAYSPYWGIHSARRSNQRRGLSNIKVVKLCIENS